MSEVCPNSVFVGGLSYSIGDDRLREFFSEAGPVKSCRVFTSGGRSKGMGVVEFEDEEGYKKALEMTEREFDGRRIFVRENREPPRGDRPRDREGGDYDRVGYGGDRGHERRDFRGRPRESVAGLQLFVTGVPDGTNWRDLKDFFASQFKAPGYVEIKANFRRGEPSTAIVRYDSREDANEAIEKVNGADFSGNRLGVKLDERV